MRDSVSFAAMVPGRSGMRITLILMAIFLAIAIGGFVIDFPAVTYSLLACAIFVAAMHLDRVRVRHDRAKGVVLIERSLWPLPARKRVELRRAAIRDVVLDDQSDGDGESYRFAFVMEDASRVPLTQWSSNISDTRILEALRTLVGVR